MFHAELEGPMNTPEVKKLVDTQPSNKYSTFLASRPRAAENDVRVPLCAVFALPSDHAHLLPRPSPS